MANLFIIVSSDRSRLGALADCFRSFDPEFLNTDVDRIETLLEVIESRSCFLDKQLLPRPSALCGSAPRSDTTLDTTPKADRPKTPVMLARTK